MRTKTLTTEAQRSHREPQRGSANAPRFIFQQPVRASQISDLYSLLDGLPKLDLVAIRVSYPSEFPIPFVVFTLINRHALRPEMRKSFRHAFYAVVNPTRSWLIRDVLISGHNRPRYRSLDLGIFNIPIFKRCID